MGKLLVCDRDSFRGDEKMVKKKDVEKIVEECLRKKINAIVFDALFYATMLIPAILIILGIYFKLSILIGMGIGIWLGALVIGFLEGLRDLVEPA